MIERLGAYAAEALRSLRRDWFRSALTMIGMVIGTGAIIAVFGISRAASSGIATTIASFGDPAIFVQVDPQNVFPDRAAIQYRDVAKIRSATSDLLAQVSPNYGRTFRIDVAGKTYDEQVNSADGYAPADRIAMAEGRKIDERDVAGAAHVCTLTSDLAAKYFGDGQAVGRVMKIGGSRFTVIGVYGALAGNVFNALAGSGTVFIPYSTFHEIVPGRVDFLLLYPRESRNADAATQAVVGVLQRLHGPKSLYFTQNAEQTVLTFEAALNVLTAGLSAIGAIALLVAGIGTMNIMLVSVAERTHEIGLRRAIGASRRDIRLQFLIESVLLSLTGGSAGLSVGLLATLLVATYVRAQLGAANVPYAALLTLAASFSLGIGVAFGLYPAIQASRMDPVEALRS